MSTPAEHVIDPEEYLIDPEEYLIECYAYFGISEYSAVEDLREAFSKKWAIAIAEHPDEKTLNERKCHMVEKYFACFYDLKGANQEQGQDPIPAKRKKPAETMPEAKKRCLPELLPVEHVSKARPIEIRLLQELKQVLSHFAFTHSEFIQVSYQLTHSAEVTKLILTLKHNLCALQQVNKDLLLWVLLLHVHTAEHYPILESAIEAMARYVPMLLISGVPRENINRCIKTTKLQHIYRVLNELWLSTAQQFLRPASSFLGTPSPIQPSPSASVSDEEAIQWFPSVGELGLFGRPIMPKADEVLWELPTSTRKENRDPIASLPALERRSSNN